MPIANPPFRPSTVSATVTDWQAGAMTVQLRGAEASPSLLLISENWYPDWRAVVDGKAGAVRRVNHSLLGVDLPSGAREVRLRFDLLAGKAHFGSFVSCRLCNDGGASHRRE